MPNPFYVTVDIEAAGANPGGFSLLSIGAATVEQPRRSFYIELKPVNRAESGSASKVHGLSLERLEKEGTSPEAAMQRFAEWLEEVVDVDQEPVFVAFNAAFDWMFVNDYFHRYLGHNPFGHRALDMKAVFMGMHAVAWAETTHQAISEYYGLPETLQHQAEDDAVQEAELFGAMLAELEDRKLELTEERLK